jgi:hypothetical protein
MRKLCGVSAVLLGCASLLGACGGSTRSAGSSSQTVTVSSVQSCLQQAGYGVTTVPAADVATGGAENRGPGQTGELWVGLAGARPADADHAAAIVAFWDSPAHAQSSPNAQDKSISRHADAIGSVTVQPANPLFRAVIAQNRHATPSQLMAGYKAAMAKIEACAR